jgi:hypothetical protein
MHRTRCLTVRYFVYRAARALFPLDGWKACPSGRVLYDQATLLAEWGTSGKEGRNRRFLYKSDEKHLLCSDPSAICLWYCVWWCKSAMTITSTSRFNKVFHSKEREIINNKGSYTLSMFSEQSVERLLVSPWCVRTERVVTRKATLNITCARAYGTSFSANITQRKCVEGAEVKRSYSISRNKVMSCKLHALLLYSPNSMDRKFCGTQRRCGSSSEEKSHPRCPPLIHLRSDWPMCRSAHFSFANKSDNFSPNKREDRKCVALFRSIPVSYRVPTCCVLLRNPQSSSHSSFADMLQVCYLRWQAAAGPEHRIINHHLLFISLRIISLLQTC